MKICMIAAENADLPGAKVGGLGDVLRDIPRALAELGNEVDIVMPGYGYLPKATGARPRAPLEVRFRGESARVEVCLLELDGAGVRCWLLDHPGLAAPGPGRLYHHDPPQRPFARDAAKFALFGAAACRLLADDRLGDIDVIHLHDWHAAFFALLARRDPHYRSLAAIRLVLTIHNLAMQGIRPFADDESSLGAWFPGLTPGGAFEQEAVMDPRWPNCFNPLRAAINLCDKVHTVSPTYAEEICHGNDPELGFHGGEGLEADLQRARSAGNLIGILNGCEYGHRQGPNPLERTLAPADQFVNEARRQLLRWVGEDPKVDRSHFWALERLASWHGKPPRRWITSISRLTPQKMSLFQTETADGASCLDQILAELPANHAFVLLGSGDAAIEDFFAQRAARADNFLFLNGYSEALSEMIYSLGDLFLMPSSFEPCGIGQMLAMRAGQPCLAHCVGGLRDTIENDIDGFTFSGRDRTEQAAAFLATFKRALRLKRHSPRRWAEIRHAAATRRFSWVDSARQYRAQLYGAEATK